MFVVNDAVFSLLEIQSKSVCVGTRQKERQNDLVERDTGYRETAE